MPRLKRALVGVLAAAVLAVAAPFAAAGVAESSAPAPVRAVADQLAPAKAEAAWPHQCRWKWQRVAPYTVFGFPVYNYAYVYVCYQIPR